MLLVKYCLGTWVCRAPPQVGMEEKMPCRSDSRLAARSASAVPHAPQQQAHTPKVTTRVGKELAKAWGFWQRRMRAEGCDAEVVMVMCVEMAAVTSPLAHDGKGGWVVSGGPCC
jgi:hypothetical protein